MRESPEDGNERTNDSKTSLCDSSFLPIVLVLSKSSQINRIDRSYGYLALPIEVNGFCNYPSMIAVRDRDEVRVGADGRDS